jgi:hypothetical protein
LLRRLEPGSEHRDFCLRLYLLLFTSMSASARSSDGHEKVIFAPAGADQRNLLKFASLAIPTFRIVATVTILQQGVAALRGSSCPSTCKSMRTRFESGLFLPCRRVEQGLALFRYLRGGPK